MGGLLMDKKVILVTGAAGFIGFHLVKKLRKTVHQTTIIGIDNFNDYYDVNLKYERESILNAIDDDNTFIILKGDISNKEFITECFARYKPQIVVNLAAQAGVRYSIVNPDVYIESNIIGFYNILEACRHYPVDHLVYASSSSVYGGNKKIPFSTDDKVDNPVSLYAATKKSNELLAYSYSELYKIPTTGLRFFTVYGPYGRPDMAYFSFTNKLINDQVIEVFNYGNCKRDFTYVDDIVEGIIKVMQKQPNGNPPYKIYNIGNNDPVNLLDFIKILSEELVRAKVLPRDFDFEKHKKLVPMKPGDVPITYADISGLEKDFNYKPSTHLRDGLRSFSEWYYSFYIKKEK